MAAGARLVGLIAALAAFVAGAAKADDARTVHYAVTPELVGGRLADLAVTIRFHADPSGATRLDLPSTHADAKELWRNVRDLKVDGAETVETPTPDVRLIRSRPRAALTVSYRIVSPWDHDYRMEDGGPYQPIIRPDWFYALGESLFAAPERWSEDTPATFAWAAAPAGFALASTLEAGRLTLADIPDGVAIGGRDVRILRDGETRLAIRGHFPFADQAALASARRLLIGERAFWGDPDEPFLVAIAPEATPSPFHKSMTGDGRRHGFSLAMTENVDLALMLPILAHEEFHTWNARQLGGLADGPQAPAAYWFSEGFTDFYSWRLALRAGVFSLQDFADAVNAALLAYDSSSVRTAPNTRIVADFWHDAEVKRLPYQRGALLAAIWDARLRTQSGGRESLDAILQDQRRRARMRGQRDPAAELFVKVAAAHGLDVRADLAAYIDRGEPIVLPEDVFGPCAKVTTQAQPTYDLGFDIHATADGQVVRGVRSDTAAYAAGLRDGMTPVRIHHSQSALDDAVVTVRQSEGATRDIRYKPAGAGQITVQRVALTSGMDPKACARSMTGLVNQA
jgi:predicted metalloprotease with PDZ domain